MRSTSLSRAALGSWQLLAVILAGVTFAVDIVVARGVALGIPYIVVVLSTLWAREDRTAYYTAAACTLLTIVGYLLSPGDIALAAALSNRALTLFSIWVSAVLVVRYRRKRERLEQAEKRARAIIESCGDGIITFDEGGRVLSGNPAAATIFGRERHDLLDRTLYELVPALEIRADGHAAVHELLRLAENAPGTSYETVARRPDGMIIPVEIAVTSVQTGEENSYTAVVREVTGRRDLEQQVLKIGEEERWRIGRELHEGLGQALTGTSLVARKLLRDLTADDHPSVREARFISDALIDADRYAKILAQALIPVDLDQEGLSVALRRLARTLEERYATRVTMHADARVQPPSHMAAAYIYQIVARVAERAIAQEGASWIDIELLSEGSRLRLTVEHDGLRMASTNGQEESHYRILRQWARLVGARMNAFARPEGGSITTIAIDQGANPAVSAGRPPADRRAPAY